MLRRVLRGLGLVALVLVSAALPLLAAEVVLRLMPEPNSYVSRDGREKPRFNTYVSSGLLAYELRSNWTSVHDSAEFEVTVRTNALGLRGRRVSSPKDEGTYRIVMLGLLDNDPGDLMWHQAKAQAWDANSGDGPSGPIEALPDDEIQEGLETSASFRLRYHRFLVDSMERLCEDHEVDLRIVQLAGRRV